MILASLDPTSFVSSLIETYSVLYAPAKYCLICEEALHETGCTNPNYKQCQKQNRANFVHKANQQYY